MNYHEKPETKLVAVGSVAEEPPSRWRPIANALLCGFIALAFGLTVLAAHGGCR